MSLEQNVQPVRHQNALRPLLLDALHAREVSRGELFAAVDWLSKTLSGLPARADGDKPRLTLLIDDRFLLAQWLVAALLCDCVVNPLNPQAPAPQLAGQLSHFGCDVLVTDQDSEFRAEQRWSAQLIASLPPAPDYRESTFELRGDLLLYTSGTTERPKGVLLKASQLAANVATAIASFGYDADWVTASVLPFFHSFTIVSDLLVMLRVGGTCVICECCTLASLPRVIDALLRHRVRSYSAVPLMLQMLARMWPVNADAAMRFAISGAAPFHEQVRESCVRALGHTISTCYGMTEAGCFITIPPLGEHRPGSVGKAAGLSLRVLDEARREVANGTVGEIAIRGPSVIANGYFERPDLGANLDAEGYFLTGDLGRVDESGWVHLTGRRKNMLIRAGEKVFLEDVDRLLAALPEVQDCASIVLSEPGQDDEAATFIVTSMGPDFAHQIRRHVRENLGERAVPVEVYRVMSIPRTATGKARNVELLAHHLRAQQPAPETFPAAIHPNEGAP